LRASTRIPANNCSSLRELCLCALAIKGWNLQRAFAQTFREGCANLQPRVVQTFVPSCSCGRDSSLGNAPPGRLQVYGFWISSASNIGQRLLSEREYVQGMNTRPTQTWDWACFSKRASQHLCHSLPVVFGVGYLCLTLSLSLGVRLLCIRGMVVKRIVSQSVLLHMWRAHLKQTRGLQRLFNVRCDDLADNDLGTCSGCKQRRNN
jgi:hypothetical protein